MRVSRITLAQDVRRDVKPTRRACQDRKRPVALGEGLIGQIEATRGLYLTTQPARRSGFEHNLGWIALDTRHDPWDLLARDTR
jgi:hypothetical protein